VIISAGSINSPQLLMLSGIAPRDVLKKFKIPVVHELSQVGRNLQDHLMFCKIYAFEDPQSEEPASLNEGSGSYGNIFKWQFHRSGPLTSNGLEAVGFISSAYRPELGNRPDIEYSFIAAAPTMRDMTNMNIREDLIDKYMPDEDYGMIICPTLLHPKSVGSVTINSTDPFVHPVIDANYLHNNIDMKTLMYGLGIADKIAFSETFASWKPKSLIEEAFPDHPKKINTWILGGYDSISSSNSVPSNINVSYGQV